MKKEWRTPKLEELDVKMTMFGFGGGFWCKIFPSAPFCDTDVGGGGNNDGGDDNIFDS